MRRVQGENFIGEQLNRLKNGTGRPTCLTWQTWQKVLAGLGAVLLFVALADFVFVMLPAGLGGMQSYTSQAGIGDNAVKFGAAGLAGLVLIGMGTPKERWPRSWARVSREDEIARLEAGERGEQAVANALAVLDERWVLFSGVVVRGVKGDIDGVLIGPGGVFALEVKNWVGGIRYDRRRRLWYRFTQRYPSGQVLKDPAKQVEESASALCWVLWKRVTPVVVLAHPRASFGGDDPGVPVLKLGELTAWVCSQPEALDEKAIGRLEKRLKRHMR